MKAIIQDDIITNITPNGDTEIGSLPKGVGLERLRWDGKKLVDLADLAEIWVAPDMTLHAIKVPGAQLIAMSYRDRKSLINENGTIRLKTSEDVANEEALLNKNRLRAKLKKEIGDPQDQLADAYKLLCLLILATKTDDAEAAKLMDDLIPDIKGIYQLERLKNKLPETIGTLKHEMTSYYDNLPLSRKYGSDF